METSKIDKKKIEDILSLSPIQEGLLFHYLKDPTSKQYHERITLVIQGDIDNSIFEKAWNMIICENEMLRTVFRWEDLSQPVQIILKEHNVPIVFYDKSRSNIEEIRKENIIGIDLLKTPFYIELLKLTSNEYQMTVCYHHILMDGWSNSLILKEFFDQYKALTEGEILHRFPKIPYKKFLTALRKQDKNQQRKYWSRYLEGYDTRTVLSPVKELVSEGYGTHSVKLKSHLAQRMESLARESNTTISAVFYCAWGILLQKYKNVNDVLFGTTVSGRSLIDGINQAVGLYINTLPLRVQSEDEVDIRTILKQVTKDVQSRLDYENTQLVDIKNYSNMKGEEELFDSIFVVENYPIDRASFENEVLSIKDYSVEEYTNYPLCVVTEMFDDIKITFTYDKQVWGEEIIYCLAKNFQTVLEQIVASPNKKINEIEVVSVEEKNKILNEFNDTHTDYLKSKTVIDLFEEKVNRNPNNVAVAFEDESLTYKELSFKINGLAALLKERGVKPNTIVGICAERSVEMIVGILAILKSGGAYMPIDPKTPIDRLQYMLQDSNAKLILSQEKYMSYFIDNIEVVDINLNYLKSINDLQDEESVSSDDLAYVMYTSGSTGKPKGVMIEHGSIINRLNWMQKRYPINEEDVILQKTPYTFDVSVWEILWWAIQGASVYLLEPNQESNPQKLIETIKKNKISILHFVPSMLNVFLEYLESTEMKDTFVHVKRVFSSGEELKRMHVEKYDELIYSSYGTELVNLYGPTEATIDVTHFECLPVVRPVIPIGKPIDNTRLYILDRNLNVQPIGVPGELCISGDGVARGYLNKPELTEEKFIASPFVSGERIYRTGDRARWLPDGNIEYLGRLDHQVKIRGYRIELSEIDYHLLKHPEIQEVVSIIKTTEIGDKQLIAFYKSNKKIENHTLVNFLLKCVPSYMVPSQFVKVANIPLTKNGKIDRAVLSAMEVQKERKQSLKPQDDIENKIYDIWREVLQTENININENFFEVGGNSVLAIRLLSKLKSLIPDLTITSIFKYPTIKMLSDHFKQSQIEEKDIQSNEQYEEIESKKVKSGKDIAIVGLACRFPGAKNAREFWDNLMSGKESTSFYTEEELIEAGIDPELVNNPNYVKAKGMVEGIEYFDASFFGYSPKEAKVMDPQLRFLHECTWEALEDAGYSSDDSEKNIGLFVGATNNFFWLSHIFNQIDGSISQFETNLLNDRDFLTSRVSYKLNLTGPSITLQTACSTSLVAVDTAIQNIQSDKCKMAIAGGVSITYPSKTGYIYQEGMVNSPDGHCRAFDEEAAGTVQGTGVGLVVLKKLEDAIQDRDQIYAVIKASATNNDGSNKVGYTAPSIDGQVRVIKDAQRMANIDSESISYVEAHGTGTILGDPIEIEALTESFNSRRKQYCAIGSVKTNIGHLDVAAGIAGLIKTVLSLKNKMIPPSLNFKKQNPKIDFSNTPFYVNTELKKWESSNPLRAAVSSFGIGGTNAHVILEEAPQIEQKTKTHPFTNLLLSARTSSALNKLSENLLNYLKTHPNLNLSHVCNTLNIGRKDFAYRKALICKTTEEAIALLSENKEIQRGVFTNKVENDNKSMVFMFSGLGSQYINMGKELYQSEPFFRNELDKCFTILKNKEGNTDFYKVLYPNDEDEFSKEKFQNMDFSQPIIFSFEYALAKLFIHWGIKPTAMIGYSFGEYVAACIAEVFNLEDALEIILIRSKLIQSLPQGSMLSIPLVKEEVIPYLTDRVSVAIDNDSSCVISGPAEDVNKVDCSLRQNKVLCMPINTKHAVHSSMMEPIHEILIDKLTSIQFNVPKIPYISNVTGTWVTDEQTTDPKYWAEHLVKTVQFAKGIQTLISHESSTFVEIGPGNDLSQLLLRFINNENHNVLNLIRPLHQKGSDVTYLFDKLSRLWLNGYKINWENVYGDQKRQLLSLPTYPFERKYYWIDGDPKNQTKENKSKWFFGKNENVDDWYYVPSWKRSFISDKNKNHLQQIKSWIVFSNHHCLMNDVVEHLKNQHQQVIVVKEAGEFYKKNECEYYINPKNKGDYEQLVSELKKSGDFPNGILHGFLISERESEISQGSLKNQLDLGFYSLIYLSQAIGSKGILDDILITVLTNNMHDVVGGELSSPGKSTVLGPVKIIPLEYHNIKCKNIDINLPVNGEREEYELLLSILKEIYTDPNEGNVVSLRGNYRWIPAVQKVAMEKKKNKNFARIRSNGVYLITGGLGGMGLHMAEYLSKTVQANLILVGRSNFPQREEWESYKNIPHADPTIVNKIERLLEIEKNGSTLMVVRADISNEEEMKQVHAQVIQRFKKVHGVIHTAGMAEYDGIIQNKKKENIEKIFMPKLYGTLVLDQLFEELDFICICSSMAPVIYYTKLGQVAYCTANEFIDSFVNFKKTSRGTLVFGINWSDWKEIGMSVESAKHWGEKLKINNSEDIILEDGILPSEGIEIFKTVLENNYSQILVSPENLEEKIRSYEKTGISTLQEILEESTQFTESVNRPNLSTEYISPSTGLEKQVAGIWTKIFGFNEIGIYDDFFELGGDSLKALNAISKVHQQLDVKVSLTDFYKYPTIHSLTKFMSTLGDVKDSQYSNIRVAEKKDYYELSSTQLRLYILNQIESELTNYNMTFVWSIDGYIDKERLQSSFEKVITRHESLRTTFEQIDSKPYQIIHEEINFQLEFFKVEEERVNQCILEFNNSFNLNQSPLFRAGLLEISEEKRIFLVNIHHIISDGLSNNILMRDLISFYNNEEPTKLFVQYKDYSEWHHEQKETDKYKASENYWLDIYKGDLPNLKLPYDFERTLETSFEGDIVNITLDLEVLRSLKSFATKNETTVYTFLLSAFNTLLYKLSYQEDIIIGCPVAGRQHADLENGVGMFVNTLALRNFPQGQLTFAEFLNQTHLNTVKAFEHQDYQFNDLINNLELERDMSRNPLFDVMFNYQEGKAQLKFENFTCTPYFYHNKDSQFDLSLDVLEINGELQCAFEFRSKLFEKETIQRFANYFQNVIFSVLSNPTVMLQEIEILDEKEKELLVNVINDTAAYFPKEKTIIHLFEEQVRTTPTAKALCYVGDNLNYQELNERVNSLARKLQDLGIGSNKLVGILTEPSIEMVVGILAILKAGGAYVPIDTEAPVNRSVFILSDVQAEVLLTVESLSELAGEISSNVNLNQTLYLDRIELYEGDTSNLDSKPSPEDLIYTIYTSGTTGNPKGVMVTHRNINNFTYWMKNELHMGVGFNTLLLTKYFFDPSAADMFSTLTSGGTLHLVDKNLLLNKTDLRQYINQQNIHLFDEAPSFANEILGNEEKLSSLNYIIVGGENVPESLVENLLDLNYTVYIFYGATEVTVDSHFYKSTKEKPVCIGQPIANLKAYILDQYNNLVPPGVEGEICISGEGVSNGYINNDQLTVQKFIQSPFDEGFMYKTGDIGMVNKDYLFEFKGRKDNQVQINGIRVELEGIERILNKHPKINQVVVDCKQNKVRSSYLCVYFTSSTQLESHEIRSYLLEKLPPNIIPSHYIQVAYFNKTANGKIDRKNLPEVEVPRGDSFKISDDLNQFLCECWEKVLQTNAFSTTDNFFNVGGTSLLIIRLKSFIEEKYPYVQIVDLFMYPTIQKLAKFIKEKENASKDPIIVDNVGVKFPLEYQSVGEEEGYEPLSYDIDMSELVEEALRQTTKNLKIAKEDIFLGIYLYILSQYSSSAQLKVQTMLSQKDIIDSTFFDISMAKTKEDLFILANSQKSVNELSYKVSELGFVYFNTLPDTIVPFIYHASLLYEPYSFVHKFDIVIEISEVNDVTTLGFVFNELKINQEMAEKLIELYVNILSKLAYAEVTQSE